MFAIYLEIYQKIIEKRDGYMTRYVTKQVQENLNCGIQMVVGMWVLTVRFCHLFQIFEKFYNEMLGEEIGQDLGKMKNEGQTKRVKLRLVPHKELQICL